MGKGMRELKRAVSHKVSPQVWIIGEWLKRREHTGYQAGKEEGTLPRD